MSTVRRRTSTLPADDSAVPETYPSVSPLSLTEGTYSPPVLHDTYPIRALGRKTLSYQKRQWFTNVVCIFSCPFLMIIVTLLLSVALTRVLSDSLGNDTVLYCSNTIATDAEGVPIQNIDE